MTILKDIIIGKCTWDDIIITALSRYVDISDKDLEELILKLQPAIDYLNTNVSLAPRLGTLEEIADDMSISDLDPLYLSDLNFNGIGARLAAEVELSVS